MMHLADKLIALRKKNGWSQEELAERMEVSRQAVSKWEGAQSTPDLEKMVRLARLFGVSTDFFLMDETEEATSRAETAECQPPLRRVSLQEAQDFLSLKAWSARRIALGTFLCILSPVCLLLLGAAHESGRNVTEAFAGSVGMVALLLLAASGVALFLTTGAKTAPYAYLEKEIFEADPAVIALAREQKACTRPRHTRCVTLGACLSILSLVPLFLGVLGGAEDILLLSGLLCALFLLLGIAVMLFIESGIRWESLQKLLQEGDYTPQRKEAGSRIAAVATAYWLTATAVYLLYSFSTRDWENGWIIWAVAGVLFGAVMALFRELYAGKRK